MRLKSFFISLSLIGTFTLPLSANDTDTIRLGQDIDEIQIFGIKQDRAIFSPLSQTNITGTYLYDNAITELRQISNLAPNLFIPDYGSRQYTPIFIRGIGSRVNAPSVGLYVDGIPYFDRSVLDMDLAEITKIEVLRGPQGTLFGRNASAGLINLYTASPLNYQGTNFKLSYGSYNDVKIQAYTYQLLKPNLGISLSGAYHHNDGFIYNSTRDEKADRIDNSTIRFSLAYRPTERWTGRLTANFDLTRQNGYPYALYDRSTNIIRDVLSDEKSYYRRFIATTGLSWTYEANKFLFNSQTSYQHSNDDMGIDQDFSARRLYFASNYQYQNQWSEELTLRSKSEKPYQWLVGLFGFTQNTERRAPIDYYTRNLTLTHNYDLPTTGFAAYHVSTLNVVAGLYASIGLRFDWEKAKADNSETYTAITAGAILPTNTAYDSKLYNRQFTPKFTLKYSFTPQQMIYTSVAKGYKTGGFNSAVQTEDDRTFSAEYTWNYEVGAKWSFFDNLLNMEGSLYYIDWRNQQLSVTILGLGNIVRNVGHSNSKGFELSLQAKPSKNLTLQTNYGYSFTRMLSADMGANRDYSGNNVPLSPRNTMRFETTYSLFDIAGVFDKLSFNAGITGVGKIYWDESNLTKQAFYYLLDMNISATKGLFTFSLWGKNLTDNKYMAYVANGTYAQKGKPLTIGCSIRTRF